MLKDRDFALTQRLTCKFKSRDNDPNTPEWIDFCPFKKLPRDPPYGAMGYSSRTNDWRYIAWLEFDTHTFLPSLHLPPLAEELYDHRGEDAAIGTGEIQNLASNNEFSHILLELRSKVSILSTYSSTLLCIYSHNSKKYKIRVKLYDFLWYNASFEHLFQKHANSSEIQAITLGRAHSVPRPHSLLFPGHFYSHHSEASRARTVKGIAVGMEGFLPSINMGPNRDKSRGLFRTLSGMVNLTTRAALELESISGSSTVGAQVETAGNGNTANKRNTRKKLKRRPTEMKPALGVKLVRM